MTKSRYKTAQTAHFPDAVYRYRSGRGRFLYAYRPRGKDYGNGRNAPVFQGSAVRGYTVHGLCFFGNCAALRKS